jgi:hypothetical protein
MKIPSEGIESDRPKGSINENPMTSVKFIVR